MRPEDISQLYLNTLAIYKKKYPVYITKVQGQEITYESLLTKRVKTVIFNIKDFSPPKVNIGFVNHNRHAYYVCRKPLRQFKSGLDAGNTLIRCIGEEWMVPRELLTFKSSSFIEPIFGMYPSQDEAIQRIKNGGGSVAFSRVFAVCEGEGPIWLYHRFTRVATMEEDGVWKFNPDTQYLKNLLETDYGK